MYISRSIMLKLFWIIFLVVSFLLIYFINAFTQPSANQPSSASFIPSQQRPQQPRQYPTIRKAKKTEVSVYIGNKRISKKSVDLSTKIKKNALGSEAELNSTLRTLSKYNFKRSVEIPIGTKRLKGEASLTPNGDIIIKIPDKKSP